MHLIPDLANNKTFGISPEQYMEMPALRHITGLITVLPGQVTQIFPSTPTLVPCLFNKGLDFEPEYVSWFFCCYVFPCVCPVCSACPWPLHALHSFSASLPETRVHYCSLTSAWFQSQLLLFVFVATKVYVCCPRWDFETRAWPLCVCVRNLMDAICELGLHNIRFFLVRTIHESYCSCINIQNTYWMFSVIIIILH